VEAFIGLVQEELLNIKTGGRPLNVLMLRNEGPVLRSVEFRLRNEGFSLATETSLVGLLALYGRRRPDLLLLYAQNRQAASGLVEGLASGGVELSRTPCFLICEPDEAPHMTDLLDRGLADIIVLEDNLDLLVGKIRSQEVRSTEGGANGSANGGPGAAGRLSDMNLIDLLQALGPGRKTVRLTVKSDDFQNARLLLYLDAGRIVFAQFEDLAGEEAIYEALTWAEGQWNAEPVPSEEIPPANIQASNESILMEGCRLLDERAKSGHLI
jgi:hypothetical protein